MTECSECGLTQKALKSEELKVCPDCGEKIESESRPNMLEK